MRHIAQVVNGCPDTGYDLHLTQGWAVRVQIRDPVVAGLPARGNRVFRDNPTVSATVATGSLHVYLFVSLSA